MNINRMNTHEKLVYYGWLDAAGKSLTWDYWQEKANPYSTFAIHRVYRKWQRN